MSTGLLIQLEISLPIRAYAKNKTVNYKKVVAKIKVFKLKYKLKLNYL